MVSDVSGYVLAGGRSSRMGRDKALLELGGKSLVEHAVAKLRKVCGEVHILGNKPELAGYAPLVQDLHEGCGPLGGMEAALNHSHREWSLFMPVDMPFIPVTFLTEWSSMVTGSNVGCLRIAMFTVGERPQPTLCLLHRTVTPYVQRAVERGDFKVYPVLEAAGKALAQEQEVPLDHVFKNLLWSEDAAINERYGDLWGTATELEQTAKPLWFANLNTPEDFAEAEKHLDALKF